MCTTGMAISILLKSITDTFKRQLPKSCDREGQVLKPSCKLINPGNNVGPACLLSSALCLFHFHFHWIGNNVGPAYLLSSTHCLFRQGTKPQQNTEQCLGEKRSLGIFYDPAQMSFLLPIYKDCRFLLFEYKILNLNFLDLRCLARLKIQILKVKPFSWRF